MITAVRTGTILCVIGIIASMGGFEWENYGLGGMFFRMAIFALLMGGCVVLEEVMTQRKRAKRRAILKAQKTTNTK